MHDSNIKIAGSATIQEVAFFMRMLKGLAWMLAIGITASACTDDAVPVLQEQEQARAVPKLDVSRDVALANKACIVVYAVNGKTGVVLSVSRNQLPFRLPELSTAEANRKTGRSFLRLANYETPGAAAIGGRVGISCLVPASVTDKMLEAVAKGSVSAMGEHARSAQVPITLHVTGSLAVTAAHALQSSIEEKIVGKVVASDLKANAFESETLAFVPGAPAAGIRTRRTPCRRGG